MNNKVKERVLNNPYFRYVVSFLIILLLPLIVLGMTIYWFTTAQINSSLEKHVKNSMQTQEALNLEISKLDSFSHQIGGNYKFSSSYLNKTPFPLEINQTISTYLTTNPFVENLLFYAGGKDSLYYGPNGTFDSKFLFSSIYCYENTNELMEHYGSKYPTTPQWIPVSPISLQSGRSVNYATYLKPVTGQRLSWNGKPFLIFFIDVDNISKIVNTSENSTDSYSIIINSLDDIVFTSANSLSKEDQFDVIVTTHNMHETGKKWIKAKLNGTDSYITRSDYESDLTYISIISESALLHDIKQLQRKFTIIYFLAVSIGFILLILISHHHYKPLKKLGDNIPHNGILYTHDIVELAEETIIKLRNTSATYNRDHQLLELLYDSPSNIDPQVFSEYNILLNGDYFQSAIMVIRESDANAFNSSIMIENHVESYLPTGSFCYAIKYLDWNCFILVFSYKTQNPESCFESLERSIKALNDLAFSTNIYAGKIYSSWELLYQSFYEAKTTYLSRRTINKSINCYQIKPPESIHTDVYSFIDTDLSSLCDAIEQDNTPMVIFMSRQIENALKSDINDTFMTYSLYFDAINRVLRASEIKHPGWYNEACSDISLNLPFATLEDLASIFSSICSYAILSISDKQTIDKKLTMENAVAYIDTHFCNPDFSVKRLVMEYEIEMSNFSHQFKTYTGKTVTSYINSNKIEFAKQMLKDKDATINDIALSAGYLHTSSFIRMFKQEIGIPPGEYQERIQHKVI